jgi:HTH-type transcriptional regulator/antitoxin HigA
MEQRGLRPRDLEPYIGSRGRVSEVLHRRRALTLPMIRRLAEGLGIGADVLVRETPRRDVNESRTRG